MEFFFSNSILNWLNTQTKQIGSGFDYLRATLGKKIEQNNAYYTIAYMKIV